MAYVSKSDGLHSTVGLFSNLYYLICSRVTDKLGQVTWELKVTWGLVYWSLVHWSLVHMGLAH